MTVYKQFHCISDSVATIQRFLFDHNKYMRWKFDIGTMTTIYTRIHGTNASTHESNISSEIVNPSWMFQLQESLQFMLPHHLSGDIEVSRNLSQSPITFAVKPIPLSDYQALLRP